MPLLPAPILTSTSSPTIDIHIHVIHDTPSVLSLLTSIKVLHIYIKIYIQNKNRKEANFKLFYQKVMLGISYFCVDFSLLGQELNFHFVLIGVSRFHIPFVVYNIIPNLCTDIRKTFLRAPVVV